MSDDQNPAEPAPVSANETEENGGDRDKLGRFTNGCKLGPGRPKGTLQLQHLVKRKVDEEKIDADKAVETHRTATHRR